MATFPKLKTNAVAQYPARASRTCETWVSRFVGGGEQRFRSMRQPVQVWLLELRLLTAGELAAVYDFFVAHKGALDTFTFEDPWTGIAYPDCSFGVDAFGLEPHDENAGSAALVIRNNEV
ncbi:MAG: DUF2460 domain-containing protein [Acidobacteria bacterium]|nr:DUF2460 domain-containing protein [Acidobacteriota bacterium]